jgi:hypothetical protein
LRAFDYLSTVSGGAYIGSLQDQNTTTGKIVFSAAPKPGRDSDRSQSDTNTVE